MTCALNDDQLKLLGVLPQRVAELRVAVPSLHRWFNENARAMPWRGTRDAYAVLVSETMLQQTQVATVIPFFERFIARFPTPGSLAQAAEDDVLLLWEGLGYYRRARNLQRACQVVVDQFGGKLPSDVELLGQLPGIGPYTRAAVASIAFDIDAAAVDGNVRRVLSRAAGIDVPIASGKRAKAVQALADALLPTQTAATHNQAMMELGALICRPRAAKCEACPVAVACATRQQGVDPTVRPARAPKKTVPHHRLAAAVVRDKAGRVLFYRRPASGMLAGLWDLPMIRLSADAVDVSPDGLVQIRRHLRDQFAIDATLSPLPSQITHAYTHLKVTVAPWIGSVVGERLVAADAMRGRFFTASDLQQRALPRVAQKVLECVADAEPR